MSDEFDLCFPASSANLGPAFDAAALALDFHLRVRARRAPEFSVAASGRDDALCGRIEDHLVLKVYRQILASAGIAAPPLALHFDNQIPIGKGCGSSAAARLAGVALAARFGPFALDAQRVFEAAVRLEGHPDNVAACWWGGLVTAGSSAPPAEPPPPVLIPWASLPLSASWPLLLVVPAQALPTEQARRVLPAHYSRADVVSNLQNALLLIAALQQGRAELLSRALDDRLHQPYRAALCPALPALQPLAGAHGILGLALSGAGPSVLIFLSDESSRAIAGAAAAAALSRAGIEAELVETSIARRGPGLSWNPA